MGPHPKRKIISLPRVTAPPTEPPPLPPPPSKPAPQPAAAANPGARTKRDLARSQAVRWLGQTYPAVFGLEVKPLALGIGHQVWPRAKAAGVRRRALHDALKWSTSSFRYFDALAHDGAVRCDLEGNAVEPLSDEHRRRALEMKAEVFERIHRERAKSSKGSRP